MFSGGFPGFSFGGHGGFDEDDDGNSFIQLGQPQGEVDNTAYYEELEVAKTATQE